MSGQTRTIWRISSSLRSLGALGVSVRDAAGLTGSQTWKNVELYEQALEGGVTPGRFSKHFVGEQARRLQYLLRAIEEFYSQGSTRHLGHWDARCAIEVLSRRGKILNDIQEEHFNKSGRNQRKGHKGAGASQVKYFSIRPEPEEIQNLVKAAQLSYEDAEGMLNGFVTKETESGPTPTAPPAPKPEIEKGNGTPKLPGKGRKSVRDFPPGMEGILSRLEYVRYVLDHALEQVNLIVTDGEVLLPIRKALHTHCSHSLFNALQALNCQVLGRSRENLREVLATDMDPGQASQQDSRAHTEGRADAGT